MGELPADRKYCIHCGDEIPNPSAYCPACGKGQESGTTSTAKGESEDEPVSEASVAKSDGTELKWGEIAGTREAKRLNGVYTILSLAAYTSIAGTILLMVYAVYTGSFLVPLLIGALLTIGVALVRVVNEIFKKMSPMYRLVAKAKQ